MPASPSGTVTISSHSSRSRASAAGARRAHREGDERDAVAPGEEADLVEARTS